MPKGSGGPWLVANLVALAAVAAVWKLALQQQFVSGGFGATADSNYLAAGYWNASLSALPSFVARNTRAIVHFAYPGDLALLATAWGAVAAWRLPRARHIVLALALSFAIAIGAGLARWYPYLGTRHAMFLMPLLYVCLAAGLAEFARTVRDRVVVVVATALILAGAVHYTAVYLASRAPENVRPIVEHVLGSLGPGDRVYVPAGASPAFRYYTRGRQLPVITGPYSPNDLRLVATAVDAAAAHPGRIWVVITHTTDEEAALTLARFGRSRRVQERRRDVEASLYLVEPAVSASMPSPAGQP